MHDLPDIVRLDAQSIPSPELEAAQVSRRIHARDDHGCIDSYVQPTRRRGECE